MFAVRCGVFLEDHQLKSEKDWFVLTAAVNPKFNSENLLEALQSERSVHIFTSPSAFLIFKNIATSFIQEQKKSLQKCHVYGCGVGSTTDNLVRSLESLNAHLTWNFPDLSVGGQRENGLQWTLEQLEKKGLLPNSKTFLWCKTWSNSEKILNEYKSMRQWSNWKISVFEVYTLNAISNAIPQEVVSALAQRTPICFGVKSAEVLDTVIELLKIHLIKSSISDFPRNIHFSVWEKSALQRAQQLFLQSRLIPNSEFETFLTVREQQE